MFRQNNLHSQQGIEYVGQNQVRNIWNRSSYTRGVAGGGSIPLFFSDPMFLNRTTEQLSVNNHLELSAWMPKDTTPCDGPPPRKKTRPAPGPTKPSKTMVKQIGSGADVAYDGVIVDREKKMQTSEPQTIEELLASILDPVLEQEPLPPPLQEPEPSPSCKKEVLEEGQAPLGPCQYPDGIYSARASAS